MFRNTEIRLFFQRQVKMGRFSGELAGSFFSLAVFRVGLQISSSRMGSQLPHRLYIYTV